MKKILIYTALPLNNATSVLHNDLIDVVKMLSKKVDVTILLTSKKLQKYYQENLKELELKYVCIKPLVEDVKGSHMFIHHPEYLQQLNDSYDSFLTWGLLSGAIASVKKTLKTLHEDNQFKITFNSAIMHINPFVIVDDILKKYPDLKMFCKVTDYNEPDMAQLYPGRATMLGLYNDKARNYKKIHDTEYCNFKDGFKDVDKTQDFVFGYTVTFAARKYLSDFVVKNIVESDNVKLFLKDNYWKDGKRNNLIPHEQYNEELAKSRWTLIAPSTVVTEFSLERFNEAIVRKCLPIFMKEVKYDVAFDNDNELCKFIEDNLVYRNCNSLEEFIQTHDYSKIAEQFYNLKYIQDHLNQKELEKKVFEDVGL